MKLLLTVLLGTLLTFCTDRQTVLESVQRSGVLTVVTRHSPTTYFPNAEGRPAGLEYDLLNRFAEHLRVKLNLIVAEEFSQILPMVSREQVAFAAAGINITEERRQYLRFSTRYQEVQHQLLYHRANPPPPSQLAELTAEHVISVIAGSSQEFLLKQLKTEYPELTWESMADVEPATLLESVWQKERAYALVDSTEVAQMQRFFPELKVAKTFNEVPASGLAWAFSRDYRYDSLYVESIQFFQNLQQTGELAQLIERYYSHVEDQQFDYVDTREFYRHVQDRLPAYRAKFETVAAQLKLDWRLLAAIAYQESRWLADAVSYTGVRGLMMLTEDTAADLGIEDREDPFQSIEGGSRYFIKLRKRFDEDVLEPDRTWFALAAYNVGLGHVFDARKITRNQQANPAFWVEVKQRLPLLSNPKWYRHTRHGYARGYEPVVYVRNVRHYYDMLVYADEHRGTDLTSEPTSTSTQPLDETATPSTTQNSAVMTQ